MVAEFQKTLLQFLLQSKEGKKNVDLLDKEAFDSGEDKIIFGLLETYIEAYGTQPSLSSMLEHFDREAAATKSMKRAIYDSIELRIRSLYQPFQNDIGLVRTSIIEYRQRRETRRIFKENAEKVAKGDDTFFNGLLKEINKVASMSNDDGDNEKNRGGFMLKDYASHKYEKVEGAPTFLKSLNRMTAAGGFYSPMFIVLLGAPKSFKTGLMLKIALEYVRDGYKVYYADCENGISSIRTRFKQALLECERHELQELDKEAEKLVKGMQMMGGDMMIDFYPAHVSTLADVDANLEYYRDEMGWCPDIIFYDYIDLFKSMKKNADKRFDIQDLYHHAIRLNNKWDTFSITVSPVNRKAVSKEVINMQDFGEDFAKAYNCHAAFAICRTPDEMEEGFARIIPVAQRDGVAFKGSNVCTVAIDEARMFIEEIDLKKATKRLRNKEINDK